MFEVCGVVPAFAQGHDLGAVDGAVYNGVKGFLGGGWVFLAHEGALGFLHADVPVFLRRGDGDGELFFELGEVLFVSFFDEWWCAVYCVVRVFVPREEEEFEVDGGEWFADI